MAQPIIAISELPGSMNLSGPRKVMQNSLSMGKKVSCSNLEYAAHECVYLRDAWLLASGDA